MHFFSFEHRFPYTFTWKFERWHLPEQFCVARGVTRADAYTAKNAPVATSLLTSCNNLFQQADIRMRSHGLWQLVDDKSVASCQQACCKLILKTCYPQAWCKLFQQAVTSLQMTSCNKPDFNKLVATWWNWQACCNLSTSCDKPVKLTTCNKFVAFLAVYARTQNNKETRVSYLYILNLCFS